MATEVGKLVRIEPQVSGENEKGEWIIQSFIIMTQADRARTLAFRTFSKERAALIQSLQIGTTVLVDYVPESREFEGKWYTDLRCTRIMVAKDC